MNNCDVNLAAGTIIAKKEKYVHITEEEKGVMSVKGIHFSKQINWIKFIFLWFENTV